MNPKYRVILKAFILVLAALGSYFWASGFMESLFTFRSALANRAPQFSTPLGKTDTRRVIFVLVDGLRYDTALDSQTMPFLNKLRQDSAWAKMHSQTPSYSEAGYTVLFSGAWPEISDGHTINVPYNEIRAWTQDNLFSAAKRSGMKTAASGYHWFEKLIPPGDVDDFYFTPGENQEADQQVYQAAVPWLGSATHQLVLIHLDQVDYAGHHEGGPRDPRWNAAARRVDDLLQAITAQVDLTQDTLIVVSDHGHIDHGGHGGQDPVVLEEPFLLAGAGVKSGAFDDINMVDVAPTLAALLGVNLPASNQGKVLTDMLKLNAEKTDRLPAANEAQQSQLVQQYLQAIGQDFQKQPGVDTVSEYQNALMTARNQRLNSERLLRLFVGIAWLVVPITLFFWRFSRYRGWMLISALIYLAVFNLSYFFLLRKTYSLSSVTSPENLILESAGLAMIALLVSGFVFAWLSKLRRTGRVHAAEAMLNLVLVICYSLSVFVLVNFVLNGGLVRWALPDFLSSFLGFLALIQILFVSAGGLILAGTTSLFTKNIT